MQNEIDVTPAQKLRALLAELAERGVEVTSAELHQRTGCTESDLDAEDPADGLRLLAKEFSEDQLACSAYLLLWTGRTSNGKPTGPSIFIVRAVPPEVREWARGVRDAWRP